MATNLRLSPAGSQLADAPPRPPAVPREELEEFVAATVHDLRTPLTVIKNYAEFISKDNARDPVDGKDRRLDAIRRCTAALIDMVDDLSLAVLDSEAERRAAVDVDAAMRHCRDALLPLASRDGIGILISGLPLRETQVFVNPHHLERVLFNLLGNALKYAKSGGRQVILGMTATEEEVTVSVSDNGPGISPDVRGRLFEKGARDKTRSDSHGLGLHIAQRIIQRHGGRIQASDVPDGGVRFEFSLPRHHRASYQA